ncbi:hypothetical protein SAMN06893096_10433 [Geodermatophilus pulveris]|uniref:Uncharacterized protein n=1 Tax=Geodermatophilus pulveris TaxID=1564159 RepID=A0A239ED68_9ACTN|nr:hypothetical protein SAMN06893096_10433 [Geodermatophilus pulveris]
MEAPLVAALGALIAVVEACGAAVVVVGALSGGPARRARS